MMLANLGAAQSREIRLGLIDADSVVSRVFLAVVEAQRVIGRMQKLTGTRLVGMNDCAGCNMLAYQRHCVALARHDKRQGATHDLASDNYDLAPAGLFLGEPASTAIRLAVLGFDVAAEIGAVDLYRAGQLGLVGIVDLRAHRFAQFVRQNERRLVLDVEIAAQREGADTLDVVAEERDRREVVADRQFPRMENRATG